MCNSKRQSRQLTTSLGKNLREVDFRYIAKQLHFDRTQRRALDVRSKKRNIRGGGGMILTSLP